MYFRIYFSAIIYLSQCSVSMVVLWSCRFLSNQCIIRIDRRNVTSIDLGGGGVYVIPMHFQVTWDENKIPLSVAGVTYLANVLEQDWSPYFIFDMNTQTECMCSRGRRETLILIRTGDRFWVWLENFWAIAFFSEHYDTDVLHITSDLPLERGVAWGSSSDRSVKLDPFE